MRSLRENWRRRRIDGGGKQFYPTIKMYAAGKGSGNDLVIKEGNWIPAIVLCASGIQTWLSYDENDISYL